MHNNFIKLTIAINRRDMLMNWTTISTIEDLGDQRRIVALSGGISYVSETIKEISKLIEKAQHFKTTYFDKHVQQSFLPYKNIKHNNSSSIFEL